MNKIYKDLCDMILAEFSDELHEFRDREDCYNHLVDFIADIKGYLVGESEKIVEDYVDGARL